MGRDAVAEDRCLPDPACYELDESAERSFRNKDYAAAIAANKAAFALKREPRLILNIGRAHHKLGQYDQALRAYKQYDELSPAPEPSIRVIRDQFVREAETAQNTLRDKGNLLGTELNTGGTANTPVYKKWWFWTVIGVVVVGSVAGGIAGGLARKEPFSKTQEF